MTSMTSMASITALTALARMTLWDRIAAWYQNSWIHEVFRFFSQDVFGVRLETYEKLPLTESSESFLRGLVLAVMAAVLVAAAATVYTKTVPGGFIRRLLSMGATDPSHAVTLSETGYFRSFGVRQDLRRGGTLAKLVCRPQDGGLTLAGTRPDPNAFPVSRRKSRKKKDPDDEKASLVERLTAPDRISTPPASAASTDAHVASQAPTDVGQPPASQTPEPPAPGPVAPVDFFRDRFYIPEALRIRAELRFDRKGSGFRTFLLAAVLTVAAAVLVCHLLPSLLSLADSLISMI